MDRIKVKALIFNHHPEHIWEFKKIFESLGIEPYIASEKLTFDLGSPYCSVNKDYEWRRGPVWFNSKTLFEDDFQYSDTLDGFDYVVTMNREIANNINFDPKKLFFIAAVSWDLMEMNNFDKYTKISAHPYAENFGGKYIPRFVQLKGKQENKIGRAHV